MSNLVVFLTVLVLSSLFAVVGDPMLGLGWLSMVPALLAVAACLALFVSLTRMFPGAELRVVWWWMTLGAALRGSGWSTAWVVFPRRCPGGAIFYVRSDYDLKSYETSEGGLTLTAKLNWAHRGIVQPSGRWGNVYTVRLWSENPLDMVAPLPDQRLELLSVPLTLGIDERGDWITWDPVSDAGHVIVQGRTRSGKSVFAYSLLTQLAYRPQVRVLGVDPSGILARPWEPRDWHSGTSEMDAAAKYLETVVAQMDRRIASLDVDADKLEDFTPKVPMQFVVLEEYPAIMKSAQAEDAARGRKPAERCAGRINAAVSRLTAEGAKVGVRVVILMQRAEGSLIDTTVRANCAVRISFAVDDQISVRLLHEGLDSSVMQEIKTLSKGVGLIEQLGKQPVMFRAPFVSRYGDYRWSVQHGRDSAEIASGGWPRTFPPAMRELDDAVVREGIDLLKTARPQEGDGDLSGDEWGQLP